MKILTGKEIQQGILDTKPTKVAVAYVGEDWRSFLADPLPSEIILSPTLGSNPWAIEEIAKALKSWDKVHFLRELHAKIYLADSQAVVGSSNLTKNGLSGEATGLKEACVLIEEHECKAVCDLHEYYESLRKDACKQFATTGEKIEAVARLKESWKLARSEGLFSGDGKLRSLLDFDPADEDLFHIVWYTGDDGIEFDEANLENEESTLKSGDIRKDGHWMNFLHGDADHIKPGQWMLAWKEKYETGLPAGRPYPYWIYVHHVIPESVSGNGPYTTLALQHPRKRPGTQVPFAIGKREAAAIRKVLALDEFALLRGPVKEDNWSITQSIALWKNFLLAIKREVAATSVARSK